jgi:hypothetical protein
MAKQNPTPTLNPTERAALIQLLDNFAGMLSNAGCNDFYLPPTEENRVLRNAVWQHFTDPGETVEDDPPGAQPLVADHELLAYLRDKE